jgi:hypothetical protein
LHFLWWRALTYAPSGDLNGFTDSQLARWADWENDPALLVEGLKTAGFVDDRRCLHDWHDYAGRWIERRDANAMRAKAARDRVRMPIYDRDAGRCRYCGVAVARDAFIVDHVYPMRRGGGDEPTNLATACGPCNTRKNNRTPDQAGMPLLPIPSTAFAPRHAESRTTSRQHPGLPDLTGPDLTGPDLTGTPPNPPASGGAHTARKRRRSNGLMAPGACGGCGAADHESKDCPTYGGVFRRISTATTTEGE